MSKSSGYAPTPQSMSRPASPGPALGAGYTKDEDREALMMGPIGERRNVDKVDASQTPPAAKDQSERIPALFRVKAECVVPPILSYCLASIMMTVVNKVSFSCTKMMKLTSPVRSIRSQFHNDLLTPRYSIFSLCTGSMVRQANGHHHL